MSIFVKNGGVWVESTQPSIKSGGIFSPAKKAFVKDGGTWKECFSSGGTGPVAPLTGHSLFTFENESGGSVEDKIRPGSFLELNGLSIGSDGIDGPFAHSPDAPFDFALADLALADGEHYTLSFWVRFLGAPQNGNDIIVMQNSWADKATIEFSGTEALQLKHFQSSGTAALLLPSESFTIAEWTHCLADFDGSNISITINNGTPNTMATDGNPYVGMGQLRVGLSPQIDFDTISVYDRILTTEERTQIFNYRAGG